MYKRQVGAREIDERAEPCRGIGHVVQHAERPYDVEARVAERSLVDVALDDVTIGAAAEMPVGHLDTARQVDADDLRAVIARDHAVPAEPAADVQNAATAEIVERERVAEITLEVDAPLRRELRPWEVEIEPLAREARERVGKRIGVVAMAGQELRMIGEEARMTCTHLREQRRSEEAGNAPDDRIRRRTARAAERAFEDLALGIVRRRVFAQHVEGEAFAAAWTHDQTEDGALHVVCVIELRAASQGAGRRTGGFLRVGNG